MKQRRSLFFASIWLTVVVGGMGVLLVYDYTTTGKDEKSTPKSWVASTKIPHRADLPTLILFAHPKCPCTRASIGELAILMAQCQGKVNAYVAFYRPKGMPEDWAHTDLWQSAADIPGVKVLTDEDGHEAADFHATTSGHVVLYDTAGALVFSGGITESRGHSGDNTGRSAITGFLDHGVVVEHTTHPTFGCSLVDPKAQAFAMQTPCAP